MSTCKGSAEEENGDNVKGERLNHNLMYIWREMMLLVSILEPHADEVEGMKPNAQDS